MANKLFSLGKVINDLNASAFCLQETFFNKSGNIKFPNSDKYQIFELNRNEKGGGGLVIGAHKALQPVWVNDGNQNVEAITIQLSSKSMNIRITNAYGPQEYDPEQKKSDFWNYLDNEILECIKEDSACLIFMDGNAWLGSEYIKNDPHSKNKNGELFGNFISRNSNINLLNASNICRGLITRSRLVNSKKEESVIDFVLACNKVLPFVQKMTIDEEKIYALANYSNKQKSLIYSDHNSIIVNLNLKEPNQIVERKTIFNFRNSEGLKAFRDITTFTNKFSKCFYKNTPFNQQCKRWSKLVKSSIVECFKKIRITTSKNAAKKCNLFQKRKKAIKNNCKEQKLNAESDLMKDNASINYEKILKSLQTLNGDKNKQNSVWKLKHNFFPKIKPPLPVAKKNLFGKVVTNPKALKKLYIEHFAHRMRQRPILPSLKSYQKTVEEDFYELLKISKMNKSPDWTLDDLNKVLRSLKRNQSQDTMEFSNEIFLNDNIGSDLRKSVLLLCNNIKNNITIPDFMKHIFVTAIPKKQKSPLNLENERFICLVPKIRSVLIKLIYNSIIGVIENNLTSSNIGARKGRSPRDHLFVLHSVVNETLRGKEGVDLIFYDVVQCFDSLWVQRTLKDLHSNGVTTDLLNLLHELSKKALISVKTPIGHTEEKEVEDLIMQGETISSILCTNTMDVMSKECELEPHKYKEEVDVPKMGFVDDLLDINRCGEETVRMNEYTRNEINKRKLQLSYDKCARMHIKGKGEKEGENKCQKVVIDMWKEEKQRKGSKIEIEDRHAGPVEIKSVDTYVYLGDTVRSDGSSKDNVKQRIKKGYGIVRDIMQILDGLFLGPFFFEALKQLRDSMLISVITHNLEVSSNITNADLKALEDLDLSLLKKALLLSSKTSHHLIYLETGILSVEYILIKKRILYYHSLMNSDNSSVSKEVLLGQIKKPKTGDWYKLIEKDLKKIHIGASPSEIAILSKEEIRKKLRKSCSEAFFDTLRAKQGASSKGKEISYSRLETQSYLKSESKLTKDIQQKVIKIRTRDVYLKSNFPMAFKDRKCSASELCLSEESQKHIFSCSFLSSENQLVQENIKYEDIFRNCVKSQEIISEIFFQRYKRLKTIITSRGNNGRPHDPSQVNRHFRLGIREARREKMNKQNKHKLKGKQK